MKFAVFCFLILQVAVVDSGLFTRHELKNKQRNVSSMAKPVKDLAPQSTAEPLNLGWQRTLFTRRGVYECQRLHHAPKAKVAPTPSKRTLAPIGPKCSMLSESCLPRSRCCDPCASCHCHFFNAICYCQKTSLHCGKRT